MNRIRPSLDRPPVDRTGLTGNYDVVLRYLQGSALRDGGPSLMDAVQSQLGLKIESKKGAVEVLVIDHAETVPIEQ